MTTISLVKLKALANKVQDGLVNDKAAFYRPSAVLDMFEQFEKLKINIRVEYPEIADDIPTRGIPPKSGTTEWEGEGIVGVGYLEVLGRDIRYCIDLLSGVVAAKQSTPQLMKEGIYFQGQTFDAFKYAVDLIRSAAQSIMLIDGYIDVDTLNILSSKKEEVTTRILTSENRSTPVLSTASTTFNRQYGQLEIRYSNAFHDRFLVLDQSDIYHFGASIKDFGNKCFMFSRVEEPLWKDALLKEIEKVWAAAIPKGEKTG